MKQYPTLPELLKKEAGHKAAETTARQIVQRLNDRHPDYTAVAVFKAGPLDSALIVPVGPSCPISTLEEAAGATVKNKPMTAFWRKPK